jgi:hypothetical protein
MMEWPSSMMRHKAYCWIEDFIYYQSDFRNNRVFCGGKGIKTESPFEQHIKNSKDTNEHEDDLRLWKWRGASPRSRTEGSMEKTEERTVALLRESLKQEATCAYFQSMQLLQGCMAVSLSMSGLFIANMNRCHSK